MPRVLDELAVERAQTSSSRKTGPNVQAGPVRACVLRARVRAPCVHAPCVHACVRGRAAGREERTWTRGAVKRIDVTMGCRRCRAKDTIQLVTHTQWLLPVASVRVF